MKNLQSTSLADQPKIKCYGDAAALCVEATLLQSDDQEVTPTVNLEFAPRSSGKVDWSQKQIFQLSIAELPVLCGVMCGFIKLMDIKRPGKGVHIERQDNRIYFRCTAGAGILYHLPLTIGDSFRLSTLVLSQLSKQSMVKDTTLMMASLRGATALYKYAG